MRRCHDVATTGGDSGGVQQPNCLSLYYDIELKEPLKSSATGGAMYPTTTIITKDRIYVPVPKELEAAFQITGGAKEFYVRFDSIP